MTTASELIPTTLPGVVLIRSGAHHDERGTFCETYSKRVFEGLGIDATFVQDNLSVSAKKGVIRGLHFQTPPSAQGKLVRVMRGAIFDVAVDLRRRSPTYGQHVGVTLTAENRLQFWVPEGFAHGFCTLEPDTAVFYKVTAYYEPACEAGLRCDDPDLGISWPVAAEDAILSEKDRKNKSFRELPAYFD